MTVIFHLSLFHVFMSHFSRCRDCVNGDIATYMKENSNIPLYRKLAWAIDIANGMAWFHARQASTLRILDLTNVLLDKNLVAKVAGFGWSYNYDSNGVVVDHDTAIPRTRIYWPPEVSNIVVIRTLL